MPSGRSIIGTSTDASRRDRSAARAGLMSCASGVQIGGAAKWSRSAVGVRRV